MRLSDVLGIAGIGLGAAAVIFGALFYALGGAGYLALSSNFAFLGAIVLLVAALVMRGVERYTGVGVAEDA